MTLHCSIFGCDLTPKYCEYNDSAICSEHGEQVGISDLLLDVLPPLDALIELRALQAMKETRRMVFEARLDLGLAQPITRIVPRNTYFISGVALENWMGA